MPTPSTIFCLCQYVDGGYQPPWLSFDDANTAHAWADVLDGLWHVFEVPIYPDAPISRPLQAQPHRTVKPIGPLAAPPSPERE